MTIMLMNADTRTMCSGSIKIWDFFVFFCSFCCIIRQYTRLNQSCYGTAQLWKLTKQEISSFSSFFPPHFKTKSPTIAFENKKTNQPTHTSTHTHRKHTLTYFLLTYVSSGRLLAHYFVIINNKTVYYDIIYIPVTHQWTGENKMGGGLSAKSF